VLKPTELVFVNETSRSDAEIFVPPSELKKTRNELLAALDSWFLSGIERRAQAALLKARTFVELSPARVLPSSELLALTHRDLLSPSAGQPVPFASLAAVQQGSTELSSLGGFVFVPLPPVMMDDDAWSTTLQTLLDGQPNVRFAIGLNNVGHLDLAGRLANHANCFFFVDFHLYVANLCALTFLTEKIARLLFAYSWIEADEGSFSQIAGEQRLPPVVGISGDYRPPLFYSLGCYERHALGRGRCRDECQKDFIHELRQGKNRFDVVVKDCVTYLFQTQRRDHHGGNF